MGYTGAEIQAVCREALLLALRERREGSCRSLAEGGGAAAAASPTEVGLRHLDAALAASPPATKEEDLTGYRAFRSGQ